MERRITIEESCEYKNDYQIRMLQANHLEGLLPVRGRGMNGSSFYDYDVSGKISMRAMFERSEIKSKDIKKFLSRLKETVRIVEEHLLKEDCILLDPEYIFYEEEQYFFCYYPVGKESLWKSFHNLTEFFVKHTDHKDKQCVEMSAFLHKETIKENYSLDKVIAECLKIEEPKQEKEERMPIYDTAEMDWFFEEKSANSLLKETDNLWLPMKRFLNKHKKSKWGDWDGLYLEDEEFV